MSNTKIKILIFSLLTVLASIFFWWRILNFFVASPITAAHLIYGGIALLVFMTIILIFFVSVDDRKAIYLTIGIIGIAFIILLPYVFSNQQLNYYYLIFILIFLVSLMTAYEVMSIEKNDRIHLSLGKIWQRGLPHLIIGTCLIISVIYYFHPLMKLDQTGFELPSQVVAGIIKPIAGMLGKTLSPFYESKMTVDEILAMNLVVSDRQNLLNLDPEMLSLIPRERLATMKIDEILKDPGIGPLIKEQILQKAKNINPLVIAQQREEFAKQMGITLAGNENMERVLTKLVNTTVNKFAGPYTKQVSLIIAILLFFLFKIYFRGC